MSPPLVSECPASRFCPPPTPHGMITWPPMSPSGTATARFSSLCPVLTQIGPGIDQGLSTPELTWRVTEYGRSKRRRQPE